MFYVPHMYHDAHVLCESSCVRNVQYNVHVIYNTYHYNLGNHVCAQQLLMHNMMHTFYVKVSCLQSKTSYAHNI